MPNLDTLNRRLKEDKVRVRIEERGASLYLRATLPCPKTGEKKQQRIRLGTDGMYDLVKASEDAHELWALMQEPDTLWIRWNTRNAAKARMNVGEFKEECRKFWEAKGLHITNWKTKWQPVMNKLPPDALPLSTELLVQVVEAMPAASSARRDQGNSLAQAARHLGLDADPIQEACRGYGGSELQERILPSDEFIEELYLKIRNPHWRWMYGMIATYGLRPHEIVRCEFDSDHNVLVHKDTKTGARLVWACHSKWIRKFNLLEIVRPPYTKYTVDHAANQAMHQKGPLPWGLYNLRHAYGVRLFHAGVPSMHAAKCMGHTIAVHNRDYGRWYDTKRMGELKSNYVL